MSWFPQKPFSLPPVRLTGKRARVWKKTDGRCGYCGCPLDPSAFHIDHVVPKRLGGLDDDSNLLACCVRDNLAKGSLTLEEFRSLVERRNGHRSGPFARLWRSQHRFYFERKGVRLSQSSRTVIIEIAGDGDKRRGTGNPPASRTQRQRRRDRVR